MALGRAFIEVHADLRPFKKDLGGGISSLLKQTQAAVNKAVREGLTKAEEKVAGGQNKRVKVKVQADVDVDDNDPGLDRMRKKVSDSVEEGGKRGLAKIWESPGKTFDQLTLVLIGAIAASAPIVVPMLGGIIAAGIGAAGIGAGIALAFQDTRIRSAASDLGQTLLDGLSDAAGVFVEPLLDGFKIIAEASGDFMTDVQRGFRAIAPYVDDLVQGFTTATNIIGEGFATSLEQAGPFVEVLAEGLPIAADAFAYLMTEITGSEGARAGLLLFFQTLADIIIFVTDVITFFSSILEHVVRWIDALPDAIVPDQIQEDVDAMVAAMEKVPGPASDAQTGLLRIRDGASEASSKAKDLTASLNEFFGLALGWSDASIRFEESIDNVAAAFRENGDTIDINTDRGRTNVRAVNDAIKAAIALRDAKIKETGSVADGNAVYSEQIDRLRGVLRNAGLTKTEIDKLIGAYDKIPPEVSTDVNVTGLASSLSQAQALARTLSSINSQNIRLRQAGRGGGPGGYAEGGIVDREQLAWVGEGNRPEAIIPLTNPGRAAEVMAEAGLLGMGGGTVTVQLVLDGKIIDERVVKVSQAQARTVSQRPRVLI